MELSHSNNSYKDSSLGALGSSEDVQVTPLLRNTVFSVLFMETAVHLLVLMGPEECLSTSQKRLGPTTIQREFIALSGFLEILRI